MGRGDSGDELTRGKFTWEYLPELLYKIVPTFSLSVPFFMKKCSG